MLSDLEQRRIDIFDAVRPGVVYISTVLQAFNPMLMNVMEIPSQTGSGFVWDDSHIVTNYHVVGENTKDIQVTFVGTCGTRDAYRGIIRGVDRDKDVAVIKITDSTKPYKALRPLEKGTSESLRVGQSALAIGNPFGLDHTLTTGVISGLGRQITSPNRRPIYNMIQTDAAINPGNSGGPLLDSKGRLIGMNTAIYSTSGASSGIGFAIPVDTLKAVVDIILRDGKVVRPSLGIQYLGGDQARLLGVDSGLIVLGVTPGSAAEQAGLRGTSRSLFSMNMGDIIIGMDGKPVANEADFLKLLDGKKVGDIIEMKIRRAISAGNQTPSPSGSVSGSGSGPIAATSSDKKEVEVIIKVRLQKNEETLSDKLQQI
eukprot:gene2224-4322_t